MAMKVGHGDGEAETNMAQDIQGGAMPRMRHCPAAGEPPVEVLRRVANAVAFAFHIDPEQVADQPAFDLYSESVVLPEGVISHSKVRGHYSLTRDQARIDATGADQIFLFFVEAGSIDVQPTWRGKPVTAGDILIVDLARPITIHQADHTYTNFVIGRAMLPESIRHRSLHGIVIPAEHPLAGVVNCTAHRLWDDSRRMTPEQCTAVLRSTLALLALAVEGHSSPERATIPLKATVETLIDTNLGLPELSPAWIGARLGVSRASLYRALEAYGGVTTFIADRRMQQAWKLVTSELGPPFAEIAAACGFRNASQFGRLFARRFGLSVDEARNLDGPRRAEFDDLAGSAVVNSWEKRTGIER